MKKIDLGKDNIGKLIRIFALPCIISFVVNALYNMVDQIFIGWGVGYLGNGATNVVFPIVVLCFSLSLMFGDGASAYLSIKLGENKNEEASKGVGTTIVVGAVLSVILCFIISIFLPNLLHIFGCTESLKPYAVSYGSIIALGIPFMMVGTILNSIIRADGSPKFAMASMVIGAIINIILDPIFIFDWGLNLGMAGAAIATIFSQFITALLNVLYIKKFKNLKITKDTLKIDKKLAINVAKYGVSSFITQLSIVVVITVQNILLNTFGASSVYGADIPITVIGIVMKINQILLSIVIGIVVGSQPIIGYNYGAKNYDRVKATLKYAMILSLIVSIIAFVLFQTIPEQLISIFGSGDKLYNEFACITFRVFLMFTIVNGIQIGSGIFFQAIGKPGKSTFLTLSRQILFFIPFAIILSNIFGIMGLIYAGPIADALAFIIAFILLIIENKNLSKSSDIKYSIESNNKVSDNKNIVIALSREYGSGGRYVAKLVAEQLGLKFYDKELIEIVSNKSGLSTRYIEESEQHMHSNLLSSFNNKYFNNLSNDDDLFLAEQKSIKEVAKKGSCIIVGRCSTYALKDEKNVLKIFLYSDLDSKVKRATKYYGLNKKDALKEINKINKSREKHFNYYTGLKWKDSSNYDLCINVDKLGVEKTAEAIVNYVNIK